MAAPGLACSLQCQASVASRGQSGPTPAAARCPVAQPSARAAALSRRPRLSSRPLPLLLLPLDHSHRQEPALAPAPRNVSFTGLLSAEQPEISLGIWHILAFLAIFVASVT